MKARSRISAFTKVAGSIMVFLLLFFTSTSFNIRPASDGVIEKAFRLDNFCKETAELTVEVPGAIKATAEWAPAKAELALVLFGPGQMNFYKRSDGKSPLELQFEVTDQDIAEGATWKLKVINQSGETVEGMLRITYPLKGEAEALQ